MERMVARLNVEHFREQLKNEADDAKRHMLLRLIAEEEAKLKALTSPPEKNGRTVL